MLTNLMLAAAVAVAGEAELVEKLPGIFAKSAAHYRALDAAATPLMKDAKGVMRTPHGWLGWKGKRELDMRPAKWWTAGHYPGSLWYLYEATGDDFFRDRATAWTEILAPNAKETSNHDVGFIMYCSYGNARRLLNTNRYDGLLRETAESLCKRYDEGLGLIRSWGKLDEKANFLVIPDNMMNLELLEWAATRKGGKRFAEVARSHADVTMAHHFRPDGGCYHVLDYDQVTKRVKEIKRGQGASCETAWSRGQSWAIYGYVMMYRTSGYVRYLDFAKKLADYAIGHPNMPADGIPLWDYGAPGEERDTSAGAIMASALVELSQYVGGADRARYRAFAVRQLLALASPAYFSEGDEIGHFLLKHGVGHKPGGSEVDTPLDYGDYYFLEALLRFRELKAREAKLAALAAKLPAKAVLPKDEFDVRFPANGRQADKLLKAPIPETADDLYGEYWTTGNRSHYQDRFFARLRNMIALVRTEAAEGKGRYLARIEDYLRAVCDMKSWVLPAHDHSDGGRGTFRGTWITTDLVSTEMGANLACVLQLLGDRLDPALVGRVKAECERRVLAPVRREARIQFDPGMVDAAVITRHHWWVNCENNWNAVCWDNVVCCALGLVDDPVDRAQFVSWADRAAERYLRDGFAADGYCSEGMGYWNYGFGHHLQTGRLLDLVTDGKFDFFRRPKQKLAAAYARAYTLREGASPAFADGNGAASSTFLALVDRYWPDLPKALPPQSEFPDGQVWLFRDAEGLSVAFKGGHNDELHNHNDVGSYYVMFGDSFVGGDAGGEEYTRFTFGPQRYDSKINNSFGHPVPVVGGKLQSLGRKAAAKVVAKDLSGAVQKVALDLTAVYAVPALKSLVRTFAYDRAARTFVVTDKVEFSEPTAFESPFNTFLKEANPRCAVNNGSVKIAWNVRPEIAAQGGAYEIVEEDVANPNRISPRRVAVRFKEPVLSAEVSMTYALTPSSPSKTSGLAANPAVYLDVMERAVRAYTPERIEAFVRSVEERGVYEHGFPRLASNLGVLLANGRLTDRRDLLVRMTDLCAREMPIALRRGNKYAGNDFAVKEVVCMLDEIARSGVLPEETLDRWRKAFAAMEAEKIYTCQPELGAPTAANWCVFGAASEQARLRHGLGGSREYVEKYVADQLRFFDSNGMYCDPGQPMVYDFVTRLQFAMVLALGYDGPSRPRLEAQMLKSADATLAMQSVTGEIPYGGRSNQFLHNETFYAALCEFYAGWFRTRGDLVRARRFRAAARRAVASLRYWTDRPGGVRHVKNRYPISSKYGCEDYAYFDKYMVTMGSWAYLAHRLADETIPPADGPEPDSTFVTSEKFHRVMVNVGDYTVQYDWNAQRGYDASGLGRFQRRGAPPMLGLSSPFPRKPHYRIDVTNDVDIAIGPLGWKSFDLVRAENGSCAFRCGGAEWQSRLSRDGLEMVLEGKGEQAMSLPVFVTDGERTSRIVVGANAVEVAFDGWLCRYETDGRLTDTGLVYGNRNGHYRRFDVRGDGSVRVLARLTPIP